MSPRDYVRSALLNRGKIKRFCITLEYLRILEDVSLINVYGTYMTNFELKLLEFWKVSMHE